MSLRTTMVDTSTAAQLTVTGRKSHFSQCGSAARTVALELTYAEKIPNCHNSGKRATAYDLGSGVVEMQGESEEGRSSSGGKNTIKRSGTSCASARGVNYTITTKFPDELDIFLAGMADHHQTIST